MIEDAYSFLMILPIIVGGGVSLFLLSKYGFIEKISLPKALIIFFIPLVISGIISGILLHSQTELITNDKNQEKKDLLGLGCKQLKQVLEDIITEKLKVYQESEELAGQLILMRCL